MQRVTKLQSMSKKKTQAKKRSGFRCTVAAADPAKGEKVFGGVKPVTTRRRQTALARIFLGLLTVLLALLPAMVTLAHLRGC